MSSVLNGAAGVGGAVLNTIGGLFGGGGTDLSISNTILSEMVMKSITKSSTNCFQSVSAEQSISVSDLSGYPDPSNTVTEVCLDPLSTIYEARVALEQKAASTVSGYEVQTPNSFLENAMITGTFEDTSIIGPCDLMSRSLVITNVKQEQQFTAEANCTVETTIQNDFEQELNTQIESYLENNEDVFGQLSNIFGGAGTSSVSTDLSNLMAINIDQQFVQNLANQISNIQKFTVTDSASIYVNNASQSFKGSQYGELRVVNNVLNTLKQTASFNIQQALINKNNAIEDIGNSFLNTMQTAADAMENTATSIIIIVSCIVVCVVAVGGAMYFFNDEFKARADYQTNKFSTQARDYYDVRSGYKPQ